MSSSFVGALTYTLSSVSSGIIFGFTPPFLIIPAICLGAQLYIVLRFRHMKCVSLAVVIIQFIGAYQNVKILNNMIGYYRVPHLGM